MLFMRLLAILISYGVTCCAAAVAVLLLLAGQSLAVGRNDDVGSVLIEVMSMVGPAILLVGFAAAIPFLIAIAILAYLRRTGWLAHVLAGALVSFGALIVFIGAVFDPSLLLETWYIPVAGAIGGFAYWLMRHRVLVDMVRA